MISKVKNAVKNSLQFSTIPELLLRRQALRSLTILGYHRICPIPNDKYPFDQELISATPEEFEKELRYLKQNLDLMTIEEFECALSQERKLPKRPALITFDDGYADNYDIAFPILKSLHLSACFFISTRIVGTNQLPWWDVVACCFKRSKVASFNSPFGDFDLPYQCDRSAHKASSNRFLAQMKAAAWPQALRFLEILKAETGVDPSEYVEFAPFITWDQAREMASGGMELGGHTRSHPVLGRVNDRGVLKDEIGGCYEDMGRELGKNPLAFSYPEGYEFAMSEAADTAIAKAGFKLSFSYLHHFAPKNPNNLFRLPRIHSEYRHNFEAFRWGMATAPGHRT